MHDVISWWKFIRFGIEQTAPPVSAIIASLLLSLPFFSQFLHHSFLNFLFFLLFLFSANHTRFHYWTLLKSFCIKTVNINVFPVVCCIHVCCCLFTKDVLSGQAWPQQHNQNLCSVVILLFKSIRIRKTNIRSVPLIIPDSFHVFILRLTHKCPIRVDPVTLFCLGIS